MEGDQARERALMEEILEGLTKVQTGFTKVQADLTKVQAGLSNVQVGLRELKDSCNYRAREIRSVLSMPVVPDMDIPLCEEEEGDDSIVDDFGLNKIESQHLVFNPISIVENAITKMTKRPSAIFMMHEQIIFYLKLGSAGLIFGDGFNRVVEMKQFDEIIFGSLVELQGWPPPAGSFLNKFQFPLRFIFSVGSNYTDGAPILFDKTSTTDIKYGNKELMTNMMYWGLFRCQNFSLLVEGLNCVEHSMKQGNYVVHHCITAVVLMFLFWGSMVNVVGAEIVIAVAGFVSCEFWGSSVEIQLLGSKVDWGLINGSGWCGFCTGFRLSVQILDVISNDQKCCISTTGATCSRRNIACQGCDISQTVSIVVKVLHHIYHKWFSLASQDASPYIEEFEDCRVVVCLNSSGDVYIGSRVSLGQIAHVQQEYSYIGLKLYPPVDYSVTKKGDMQVWLIILGFASQNMLVIFRYNSWGPLLYSCVQIDRSLLALRLHTWTQKINPKYLLRMHTDNTGNCDYRGVLSPTINLQRLKREDKGLLLKTLNATCSNSNIATAALYLSWIKVSHFMDVFHFCMDPGRNAMTIIRVRESTSVSIYMCILARDFSVSCSIYHLSRMAVLGVNLAASFHIGGLISLPGYILPHVLEHFFKNLSEDVYWYLECWQAAKSGLSLSVDDAPEKYTYSFEKFLVMEVAAGCACTRIMLIEKGCLRNFLFLGKEGYYYTEGRHNSVNVMNIRIMQEHILAMGLSCIVCSGDYPGKVNFGQSPRCLDPGIISSKQVQNAMLSSSCIHFQHCIPCYDPGIAPQSSGGDIKECVVHVGLHLSERLVAFSSLLLARSFIYTLSLCDAPVMCALDGNISGLYEFLNIFPMLSILMVPAVKLRAKKSQESSMGNTKGIFMIQAVIRTVDTEDIQNAAFKDSHLNDEVSQEFLAPRPLSTSIAVMGASLRIESMDVRVAYVSRGLNNYAQVCLWTGGRFVVFLPWILTVIFAPGVPAKQVVNYKRVKQNNFSIEPIQWQVTAAIFLLHIAWTETVYHAVFAKEALWDSLSGLHFHQASKVHNSNESKVSDNSSGSTKVRNSCDFVASRKTSTCRGSIGSDTSDESSWSSYNSVVHRPHKCNDTRWDDVQTVRSREGMLGRNHMRLLKSFGCGDIGSVYLSGSPFPAHQSFGLYTGTTWVQHTSHEV